MWLVVVGDGASVRLAYADPPYPGQAYRLYRHHKDYAGEVDHAALVERLRTYDGWILHTSSSALASILALAPEARVAAWVKPFAAFKKNVPVAYAWEPVLFVPLRVQVVGRQIRPLRDWLAESITMKRGLAGAKPEKVVWWCLEMCGFEIGDTVDDIFPGTGSVTNAVSEYEAALKFGQGVLPL